MAELMFPDIVGSYQRSYANAAGQRQEHEGEQRRSRLAELASQAYSAPQEERRGILGQMVGVDPEAGLGMSKSLQSEDEVRNKSVGTAARLLVAAPESSRPALYAQMRGEMSRYIPNMPEQYDETVAQAANAIARAYSGAEGAEQFTLGPGAKRFDASGRVLAEVPFAPASGNIVKIPDGQGGTLDMVWDPRTRQLSDLPIPGQQSAQAPQGQPGGFGIAETDQYVRSILGKAQVDPNAPPEQQAEQLLPHVIQQESGGNPNAVSPKGAQGLMQVMPATGRDPGFGVTPMQGGSPEENVRFGKEYLTAMLRRYPGRPDLALAAYNAGPGVADRFAQPTAQAGPQQAGALPPALDYQRGGQAAPGRLGYTPPKPQGGEESFSQPQPVTASDGTVRMVQFGNRGSQREVQGYTAPPTARDAKPPTDGQLLAAGFYDRMSSAERELDATVNAGFKPGNMRDFMTAGQGPLRNWAATDEGQKYRQQQEDWVRSKLRKESGAVIGDDEMEREIKVYFPQPGDSKTVIDQKKKSREIAIEAMKKAAGRAIPKDEPDASPAAAGNGGWGIQRVGN